MMLFGLGDYPSCAEDNCMLLYGAPCATCVMPDGSIVQGFNSQPTPANPPAGTPIQTPGTTPGALLPGGIDCMNSANASNAGCKALCSNPLFASYPACKSPWKTVGYVALALVGGAAVTWGIVSRRKRR